jgi:hypothetical protein
MFRVYAVAFLAVLLLKKNIPATAPNIATRIPINMTVSLIFVPNMGVPDPYAPDCCALDIFSFASSNCSSMLPGVDWPAPPYCAEANCSTDGTISREPAKMTIVDAATILGFSILQSVFEFDYLTFMPFISLRVGAWL